MARAGVFKPDVAKARAALIARGKHPSIDAVRVELGNTGSKGTIHRYLREIEEEEAPTTEPHASLSETLQRLVEGLAQQLNQEAATKIAAAEQLADQRVQAMQGNLEAAQGEAAALRTQLQRTEVALHDERLLHASAKEQLQQVSTERAQQAQRLIDLQAQLDKSERFRTSLEDKHAHVRASLEHFREAAREQRDREIAQYDQQIQALQLEQRRLQDALTSKQVEAGELAKEGARMAVELEHTRKTLRDELKRNETLQQVTTEVEELRRALAERERQLCMVNDALAREKVVAEALQARVQTLEPEIVALKASAQTYEAVLARFDVGDRNGTADLEIGAQEIPTVNAQVKGKAKRGGTSR